jgi:hypothetical protein
MSLVILFDSSWGNVKRRFEDMILSSLIIAVYIGIFCAGVYSFVLFVRVANSTLTALDIYIDKNRIK